MKSSGIIYYYEWHHFGSKSAPPASRHPSSHARGGVGQTLGFGLIALALGGLLGPLTPFIRLEAGYRLVQAHAAINVAVENLDKQAIILIQKESLAAGKLIPGLSALAHSLSGLLKPKTPRLATNAKTVLFTPLTAPDGSVITPVDTNFGLIIPKIGINANVIPAVDPTNPGEYEKALLEGVAHASTSYFPDQNGTVYLFSHSTSYDWFVKDLNAVFYLVKNLDTGDTVVLMYKGKEYTYRITEKKVVSPEAVSYLVPHAGARNLILQTCWPPGSTSERLLIFADLISDGSQSI